MRARDLTASLSVAGLALPEAVAYAAIADLLPLRAILAAIVGALVYPVRSREALPYGSVARVFDPRQRR